MQDNVSFEGAEQLVPAGIFCWESLRVVGPCLLPFEEPIYGFTVEIELVSGSVVKCFRADDGEFFFCHGLTFGGADAPGGAVSPYSRGDVGTILADLYERIAETSAVPGNILVWTDADGAAIHSAIILVPVILKGATVLDYATVVRSKNGRRLVADVALKQLVDDRDGYGESYRVYRRN